MAWLYITGEYPQNHIDHKNHNRQDNRFDNLRDITQQNNNKNLSKRKDNKSGVSGVHWNKQQNKWQALISIENKKKHIGYFTSFSDAVDARKDAEILYNYHKNHGRGGTFL